MFPNCRIGDLPRNIGKFSSDGWYGSRNEIRRGFREYLQCIACMKARLPCENLEYKPTVAQKCHGKINLLTAISISSRERQL